MTYTPAFFNAVACTQDLVIVITWSDFDLYAYDWNGTFHGTFLLDHLPTSDWQYYNVGGGKGNVIHVAAGYGSQVHGVYALKVRLLLNVCIQLVTSVLIRLYQEFIITGVCNL